MSSGIPTISWVLTALLLAAANAHGASMGAGGKPCPLPGGASAPGGAESRGARLPRPGGWPAPPANPPWRPPAGAYGGAPYAYSYGYRYGYPPAGAAMAPPPSPGVQRRRGAATQGGPGGVAPWPPGARGGMDQPPAAGAAFAPHPGWQSPAMTPSRSPAMPQRPAAAAPAAGAAPAGGEPVAPYAGPTDDPWATEDATRHARP